MGPHYHEDIRAYVASFGSDSQKERLAEGFLDPAEIVALRRAELYARLSDVPRYVNLKDHQVLQYLRLTPVAEFTVRYHVLDEGVTLTATEHAKYAKVKSLAPTGAVLKVRRHVMTAQPRPMWASAGKGPEPRSMSLPSVLVSMEWAGHPMSREYQLADQVWL